MKYNTKYTGKGSMVGFVKTVVSALKGLNGLKVDMGPFNGGGFPVDVKIERDGIILDFSQLVFYGGGGSAGGEAHFFKPVADTGADITIGYGELAQIGVGLSSFTEATHTVVGGTDVAKNYLIARYKYSDGVISLDERSTGPDLTMNDYMETEVCRVWLDTGDAFFDGYYGIGRYSFGGVPLS